MKLKGVITAGCLLSTVLSFYVHSAASVGFSEYRLVLTPQEKSKELTLFNKGNISADCNIGLTHFSVSKNNSLVSQDDPKKAYNPASRLLRYSPRQVKIPPKGSQKVKLMFRRKANLAEAEYMSYLKMTCKDETKVESSGQMGAIISYNIPVHLRVGELPVTTNFEVLSINKTKAGQYNVDVRQFRQGKRSLVGTFEVVDINTGEIITKKTSVGIYQPGEYLDHKFTIKNKPIKGLDIKFTENQKYGGNMAHKLLVESSRF